MPLHLGGVQAALRLLNLDGAGRQAQAVLVTTGVGDPSANPDTPSTVNVAGAGQQGASVEVQVASLINLPALALSVTGSRLNTSGVAELALACRNLLAFDISIVVVVEDLLRTHTGAVDIELLTRVVSGEQPKGLVRLVELESGRTVRVGAAASFLVGEVDVDVAVSGVDAAEVDGRRGSQRHELEVVEVGVGVVDRLRSGKGRGGSEEGSESEGLHCDGCGRLVIKVDSWIEELIDGMK